MPNTSVEEAVSILDELKVFTRRKRGFSDEDQLAQIKAWARELTKWDLRDVKAGCDRYREGDRGTWWPDWPELRICVDDAALERRQASASDSLPAVAVDPWDIGNPGVGLMVARGQLAMEHERIPSARAEFRDLVAACGGRQRAQALADDCYRRNGHDAVLPALRAQLKVDDGRTASEAALLATPEGQRALHNRVALPWLLHRRRGLKTDVHTLVRDLMAAHNEVQAVPVGAFGNAVRGAWEARLEAENILARELEQRP